MLLLLLARGVQAQVTITGFSPASGPVGSSLVITGTNFTSLTSITLGGVPIITGSYTSTTITCAVPTGAVTGPIALTAAAGSATSATSFVVTGTAVYTISNSPLTLCSGALYDSGAEAGNYLDSESYTQVLTPSTAGAKMRLDFSSFSTENGYDFLSIYDGPSTSSTLIGTFTGTTSPGTITATNATGQLTVVFTSDVSVNAAGFSAVMSCVLPSGVYLMNNTPIAACTGSFYDSGGASGNYADNEAYTKVISPGTNGSKVRLSFSSFSLENGYDVLYIYDGPSTSSTLIGSYTGTTSPGVVTATNAAGQLTVVFNSDVSVNSSGWVAAISCVSAPTFNLTSRTPAANSLTAATSAGLTLGFSATPTVSSASTVRVYGTQSRGRRFMGSATLSGNTITLPLPSPAFLAGETVLVSVPATVLSSSGATAVPYVYQYTTATVASSGRFGAPTAYATGTNPGDMVMGDITGDGVLDMVVANTADNTVSVLPGLGNGTFGTRVNYTTGTSPLGLALGDLNADGRLDVLVANTGATTVGVLLASGTGLSSMVQYPTTNVPGLIAAGDVNGDGLLDLIASNAGSATGTVGSTVSVYLNLGAGVFGTRTDYTTGLGPNGVAVGDLNNDGKLDIVTSNLNANTASVLLGTGTGAFGTKTDYPTATTPFYVSLGDLNADGRLDIVTGNNSVNGVSVLLSAAATGSTYNSRVDYTTGTTPQDVDLGDVNGDGRLDIITANQGTNNASVLLATGPGTFGTRTDFATGLGTASTALGDVNGDGRLDLAAMNSTANTVSILLGVPAPAITSFSPGSGPVGTTVTVTGTNLSGATALTLNGQTVTGFVVNGAGTSITFTVPSGATSGLISVTTPGGTASSSPSYTVTAAAQLSVTQGGFPYANNGTAYSFGNRTVGTTSPAVSFILANPGAAALALTGVSTTGNYALSGTAPTTVPAGGTATVNVTFSPTTVGLQTGTLRLVSALGTYIVNLTGTGVYATPSISTLSPASGPVGTVVTVTGTGFVSNGTTVTINGVPVTGVTVGAGGTSLTFTIPAGATSGPVVVSTQGGTVTSNTSLCVQYTATGLAANRCGAGTLSLGASGAPAGGSYAWYTQATGGTAIAGATGASYTTPSLSATTTYYVAISTGSGASACQGARTAVLATINALPVVTIAASGSTSLCAGGSVTLTASGAAAYQWSNGATTASITVSSGGSYSVTGSSAAGCSATSAATTVTVTALPAAPSATPAGRCGAGTLTLSASGAPAGGSYAWYTQATGGTAIAGATGASYTTPSLPATTTYYVASLTAGGCEGPRTPVVAIVNSAPTVSVAAGGPLSFCQGGSVMLTASGADTYLWSTGATTASITVVAGGSYTVTGSTSTGCSAVSAATAVVVEPTPATPTITQSPVGTLTSSSATGNQWYLNGGLVPGATGASYVVPSAAQNGNYTVVVSSAAGCASAASAPVAVVLTATSPGALAGGVQLFPNPAHNSCTVQVAAVAGAQPVQLTLLNALGQQVQQRLLPAGGSRTEFDLHGLASGVYLVRLQAGANTLTQRLIVE